KGLTGGLIDTVRPFPSGEGEAMAVSRYMRIQGRPLDALMADFRKLSRFLEPGEIGSANVTGASAKLVSDAIGIPAVNEFRAVATAMSRLHPDAVNVFEMGGENSKYLLMESSNGGAMIADFETNGDCAAGTGSFMDQQAGRLCYPIEEVGGIVHAAGRCPKIAGRCSVFAKSDMIHAQQKGYMPGEVLKGLCEAVARNFKSNIVRGRKITGKTVFIGGVAMNRGVAGAIQRVFDLGGDDFVIPEHCSYMGAIGSAVLASGNGHLFDGESFFKKILQAPEAEPRKFPSLKPLSREKVLFLRDRVFDYSFEGRALPVDAWLGIDVGSVSTNFALVDDEGSVIREIYLRTRARPIEVVGEGLSELQAAVGDRVRVRGVGTTGSGRELIGELVGADTVNDEITAHKTGADFIGTKLIGREVDTIFEIGGQDSKFISIEDGIVVDFAMNEACAAGTGSFLEEQAQKLDVNIVDEFSGLAFESAAPIRLGERCTVYMEQDVSSYMKKGAAKKDLIAGLSYSVVQNYLNRVVRGRHIGKVIFFQGGTAYNDSVAAAFSEVLGREIIVPPYNGVIGAIGSALLAREKTKALGRESLFHGYDISKIDYKIREFTCKGCPNYCDIKEFTVMGEKTYWGDKCSDKYRKRAKTVVKPVIPDLVRMYGRLLEEDYMDAAAARIGTAIDRSPARASLTAGIPRAMFYYDRFPFWRTWLEALGIEVAVSPPTNRQIINRGLEETVAEPCCPIQTAHGHVASLLDEGVDMILAPNVIDSETEAPEVESYLCPWAQTLPFVLRGMPSLAGREEMILAPTVHFREGAGVVEKELWAAAKRFGVGRARHRTAVRAANAAQ
ncbi:MAG: acyl-CoA dehydratase activase, partial [Candidatus Krumholzibacteria bacterium]|nr:acyl-CoA dehydratase activase [Candidatus Krumholzibacteria bacterium]